MWLYCTCAFYVSYIYPLAFVFCIELFSDLLKCELLLWLTSSELDVSSPMAPPCRDVGGTMTVADLTLKTTDSGIGSIAQRPARRSESSRRRRLVYSHALSGTSSADDDDDDEDEPISAAESTGANDIDVALMWHLARCSTIIQVSIFTCFTKSFPTLFLYPPDWFHGFLNLLNILSNYITMSLLVNFLYRPRAAD